MAPMDANRVFVDTNVWVYANVAESPWNQLALGRLKQLHESHTELYLSRQVLREFLVTLTRSNVFEHPQPVSTVLERVCYLERSFHLAEDGPMVTAKLFQLIEQFSGFGKQVHDANTVATMLAHGIPKLLTHNTSDFQKFSSVITVLPLEE